MYNISSLKCKGVFHTVGFVKKLRNTGIMILEVNFHIDFLLVIKKKQLWDVIHLPYNLPIVFMILRSRSNQASITLKIGIHGSYDPVGVIDLT